jgi:acetyl-CoA C-acetyltransferase
LREVVIASAVRTPTGKFQGKLSSLPATELGALVAAEAIRRAGIRADLVDECIMGNALQAGLGQNPARQAGIRGGVPSSASAFTVNQFCGSGLKAVALAAQAIQTGNADIVVAGGMESMSMAPYLLAKARGGYRMGDGKLIDSMIHDGLWDAYDDFHMGITAENIAEKFGISREKQDAYAAVSHGRASAATEQGLFRDELLPIRIEPGKDGSPAAVVDSDEPIRPGTTVEALSRLRPAFKEDGTVTAGNAPGVSDGAAAFVVMAEDRATTLGVAPLAYIRGQASSGIDPAWMGLAPITGIRRLVERTGWDLREVDLFELNEAFSVQALAVISELGLDPEKVNVHGGAVAIGHPIGASGARILTTLVHALIHRKAHQGIAALCLGGGNSVAVAIER